MAEALGCALADNAALDSMSFRGDTEQDAIDSLARESDLHMQPWTGTGVPWILGDQMTHQRAWLAFTAGGQGQGIVHVGQWVQAGSPDTVGDWVAFWEHACQSALGDPLPGSEPGA